jgi:hypothetical protein
MTNKKGQKSSDIDVLTKDVRSHNKSKRQSDALPQFDDEPLTVDSDEDLPTIDDCFKQKGLFIHVGFTQLTAFVMHSIRFEV